MSNAQNMHSNNWKFTFRALSNPNFRLMWIGTFLLMSGFQSSGIAQGYWVFENTHSAKILSATTASSAIPIVLFGLIGGLVADQINRKRIIQICQASSAIMYFIVGTLISLQLLRWQYLVLVAFFHGAVFAFNGPARQAFIGQIIIKRHIGNAVALIATGMSLASLISPLVGGFIYSLLGADAVYYIAAGLAGSAVLATTSIRIRAMSLRINRADTNLDLISGIKYIWSKQSLTTLMLTSLIFTMFSSIAHAFLPLFVINIYHRDSLALGILVTMMGVGALVGTLAIASLKESNRGQLFLFTGILSGLGMLLISLTPSYYAAIWIVMLIGAGSAGTWSLAQVLIMSQIDPAYRGRVMSIFLMNWGFTPLTLIPAGIFAEQWGAQTVVIAAGTTVIIIALLIIATQRELRQIQ